MQFKTLTAIIASTVFTSALALPAPMPVAAPEALSPALIARDMDSPYLAARDMNNPHLHVRDIALQRRDFELAARAEQAAQCWPYGCNFVGGGGFVGAGAGVGVNVPGLVNINAGAGAGIAGYGAVGGVWRA